MTSEATRDAHMHQSESAISAQVLDQTVILDLSADHYTRLNGTAGELWRQLADPRTARELADWLVQAHEIEPQRALRDVETFLSLLLDRGLLART